MKESPGETNVVYAEQIRGSASMGRTNEEKPNKLSTKADSAPSVWNSVENRRRFFEDFAKANGFDPRLPGHWYNLTKVDFLTEKVCLSPFRSLSSLFSTSASPPPSFMLFHTQFLKRGQSKCFSITSGV